MTARELIKQSAVDNPGRRWAVARALGSEIIGVWNATAAAWDGVALLCIDGNWRQIGVAHSGADWKEITV